MEPEQIFCDVCWAAPPRRCDNCERAYQAGRDSARQALAALRDGFLSAESRGAIDYALERLDDV